MSKIEEIYAFVAPTHDGEHEGIMAMATVSGWIPLMGADMDRVLSLVPLADQIEKEKGTPYKILKFTLSGEIQRT